MRAVQFNLFSLLIASSTAYADLEYNLTPGVTPISHDIYNLHMTVFWVCAAIGVIVFGVMIYAIINHRKSKGAKAAQFHEHLWVELTWTIIPVLILVAIAIPGTRVLINLNDSDKPDITIKITGYQWKWKYDYLDQNIHFFSNPSTPQAAIQGSIPKEVNYLREVDHPLVVPIHKKIRFLVTSNDVIHAWWVPELGVKRDAVGGFINETWTRINRPGIYRGQCAELCGLNHAFMPIVVIAMPEKDFEKWVAQQNGSMPGIPVPKSAAPISATPPSSAPLIPKIIPPVTAPTPSAAATVKKYSLDELMKQGQQLYDNTCAVCHQQDGSGMPPLYPALKKDKIVGGPVNEHMNTVLNGHPGTAMQAFRDQFTDEELAAIVTYERNAFGNHSGDVVQPDQIKQARVQFPAQ